MIAADASVVSTRFFSVYESPVSPVSIVEPDAGVAWLIARYSRFLKRFARRLAPEDSRFWPDLVQEGTIALWMAQHWRLDLTNRRDERYLRRCVKLHMRREHARLHRQAYPQVARAVVGIHGQVVDIDSTLPRER